MDQEGIFEILTRFGVDDKLINLTKELYKNPKFRIEMDNEISGWKTQKTGIRQGCTLSPYLFLIVMTVLFNDIHNTMPQDIIDNRVIHTNFNEVLFADDTICISENAQSLNKLLHLIQEEGAKYGLQLG